MEEVWQPEALRNRRLEQLQATMNDYIEKNIALVEGNLPVFYGHVAATLDKTFPGLDDRSADDFIDAVTFTLLNTTREAPTAELLKPPARHGKPAAETRAATLDVVGPQTDRRRQLPPGDRYWRVTGTTTAGSTQQSPTATTPSQEPSTGSRVRSERTGTSRA